jgi:lipopolysaccharide/colanic/teichoic acid biosynthesis glycosyltransferase
MAISVDKSPGRSTTSDLVKRITDCAIAGVALVLLSPLLAAIAVAVWLEDGPSVLYRQDRLGLLGRTIRVTKFRSLRINEIDPVELHATGEFERLVTRTGRIIRRLKLDELPQLVGVIRGDLSIVGPRATLTQYLDGYDEYQRRRLEVRPGLTGWAQVNGNVSLDVDDRIRLDVWYVDHWSTRLDARILFRTLPSIVGGERVSSAALGAAKDHEDLARRRG